MNIWLTLILFVATFILDFVEVTYVMSVYKKQPIRTGLCRVAVLCIMALGIINYVTNPLYLIPICLGSFCGASFTVWYRKIHQDDSDV